PARQLSVPVSRIAYATMKRQDVAVLELAARYDEILRSGIEPWPVTLTLPAPDEPVVVVGAPLTGALMLLRRHRSEMERPCRMWFYPVPAFAALVGWAFIYLTTDPRVLLVGLTMLALGVPAFAVWSWRSQTWPFASAMAGP
ncbi:MAG TPA: hypothetical protein VIK51_16885, partial [Vicinamibacteria bacterium]